jgi:ACS family hexuronate transporter-like MFS transporter
LSYSGGSLGAIVTPLVVVPISIAYGWRAAFLFTGLLGVVWLVLWWATARSPFLHPPVRKPAKFVIPNLFERRFWVLFFAYAVGAFALGPILYLAPLYLSRVMNVSQQGLGTILWIPPLGWEVGYFFWGWASDRYGAEKRALRIYRLLTLMSLPLAVVTLTESVAVVMLLFFWAMFISAGFIVVSLRSGASKYPPGQSSMVAGLAAGSWSALVALILPVLGGWFDQGLYARTFVTVSLMPMLGTFGWWALMPGREMTYNQEEGI